MLLHSCRMLIAVACSLGPVRRPRAFPLAQKFPAPQVRCDPASQHDYIIYKPLFYVMFWQSITDAAPGTSKSLSSGVPSVILCALVSRVCPCSTTPPADLCTPPSLADLYWMLSLCHSCLEGSERYPAVTSRPVVYLYICGLDVRRYRM
jgi:hypothetical protein